MLTRRQWRGDRILHRLSLRHQLQIQQQWPVGRMLHQLFLLQQFLLFQLLQYMCQNYVSIPLDYTILNY